MPNSKWLAKAWFVVGLLWFVALLNYLDRNMIFTLRKSLVTAIPMSDTQFGELTAAFLIVYGLFSPLAGFFADRFSRARVVILSVFIWSAVTWLTAHSTTFEHLLIARALMGLSEAAYLPAALSLIADYHRGSTRALATGLHMTGIATGSALGGLGGVFAERHDWTFAFNFFGLIGVVYALVLLMLLRDAPRDQVATAEGASEPVERAGFGEAMSELLKNRSFIVLALYWGMIGFAGWPLVAWAPTYLTERFGLQQGPAGMTATLSLNLGAIVGLTLGGAWADRWSKRDPMGRIYVPIIGMCVTMPAIFLVAGGWFLASTIAGMIGYSLFRAFTDATTMPILCMVSNPRYRATGYGVLNALSCGFGGVATIIAGRVRDMEFADLDTRMRLVFVGVALAFGSCALLLRVIKPDPALITPLRYTPHEKALSR